MPKNGNTNGPGANGDAEKSEIDPSTIGAVALLRLAGY